MIGFRTVYTDEPLPTGGPALIYDRHGELVLIVHEPSLHADPKWVMDYVSGVCDANTRAHMQQLRMAV